MIYIILSESSHFIINTCLYLPVPSVPAVLQYRTAVQLRFLSL